MNFSFKILPYSWNVHLPALRMAAMEVGAVDAAAGVGAAVGAGVGVGVAHFVAAVAVAVSIVVDAKVE